MHIRFWGVRGSIPAPGNRTALYGGNTSCVELRTDDGTLIILDCGSGIRELGLELLRSRPAPYRIYLLIGHTHWDHIQGFPFFTPAFLADTELNIYAPAGFQRTLEDSLSGQMQYSYFPLRLNDVSGHIHYRDLEEGFFRIGNVLVETQYLNHTAPTIAYRLSSDGATIVYATDHEPFSHPSGADFPHPGDQRHIRFLKGADLLIHDAQYTSVEYQTKLGWGHSPVNYAVDVAISAGVSQLALFHHDPTHDDALMKTVEDGAKQRVAANGSNLYVFAAAEQMEFSIHGKGSTTAVSAASALDRRPITGGRVLVVSGHMSDVAAIEQLLHDDGLILSSCSDGSSAVGRTLEFCPDLVIIASRLVDGQGLDYIEPIRSLLNNPDLPMILLTDGGEPGEIHYSSESISTDYIAKPFGPAMMRSRVRGWLARTMNNSRSHGELRSIIAEPQAVILPDSADQITSRLREGLGAVPLFQSMAPELLDKLLARAIAQIFQEGQAIIRQGESSRAIYVVLSGRVRIVEAVSDSLEEMFVGELAPGEVFGELGILRRRPRSASVIALEKTSCVVIPEHDFIETLHKSPDMSIELMRVIAGRIYDADRVTGRFAPDTLTGLPGRVAFQDLYRRLIAGVKRRGNSVLLLALNVIHLKSINDKFGYDVGDDVLRTVSDTLILSSRATDLVARYGDDEFGALLLDTDETKAETVIKRIQQKLQDLVIARGLPCPVECRIGYSFSRTPPETMEELLRAADQDMQSKQIHRLDLEKS